MFINKRVDKEDTVYMKRYSEKKKIKKKTKIEAERSIKGFKKALFVESKEKGNIC